MVDKSAEVRFRFRGRKKNIENLIEFEDEKWWTGSPIFVLHRYSPLIAGKPELAPFCWDTRHPYNAMGATIQRFARDMPTADDETVKDFRSFVKEYIPLMCDKVKPEDVPDFESWLSRTSYSPARKQYLRDLRGKIEKIDIETIMNQSFGKAEVYPEYGKLMRAINSYSDDSKAVLGPLFHAVDKNLFKSRHFVKGTNPRDWPELLRERYGDSNVVGTDFTAFESHHISHFAASVHDWFEYTTSNLDLPQQTRALVTAMMLGQNQIRFKEIDVTCDTRLMSGALWTSSANSFLNLVINAYLCSKAKLPHETALARAMWCRDNLVGQCEGDDGLFVDYGQSEEMALALGCNLKFERHTSFAGAGFCGIVCDPDALVVLKDPKSVWRKFFLIPARYKNARQTVKDELIRAKALSYYMSYRGSPIIGALCHEVLKRTARLGHRADACDTFHSSSISEAVKLKIWNLEPNVTASSRAIVEEKFGVSVETQLSIEDMIRQDLSSVVTGWGTSDDLFFCDRYVTRDVFSHDRSYRDDAIAQFEDEFYNRGRAGPGPISETQPARRTRKFVESGWDVPHEWRE